MLKFKLGCYNSYPLTGISSRDSGLTSKEIRIGLEFKNGVLHWGLHPRCLGRLGGVEEEEESEESGEVPGLSALLSACTSMDAYSVVSVRDFPI